MNLFHPDSKFMHYAFKFSDLISLNCLFVICSIPIFTIGASLSAMHYVLLGIFRDNLEQSIAQSFFKSFGANFRQATVIWLMYLLTAIILAFDLYLFEAGVLTLSQNLKYAIYVIGFIILCSLNWVFILQSRYKNSVLATIRNAFLFCAFHFWDTLLITAFCAIPFVLAIISISLIPIIFICGFACIGIMQAFFYSKIFSKHEQAAMEELSASG